MAPAVWLGSGQLRLLRQITVAALFTKAREARFFFLPRLRSRSTREPDQTGPNLGHEIPKPGWAKFVPGWEPMVRPQCRHAAPPAPTSCRTASSPCRDSETPYLRCRSLLPPPPATASSLAAGGRLAGGGRGPALRARVAEAAPVAAEGGRQEAHPAAPMVEIPVTCYQVNGSSQLQFRNDAYLLLL